MLTNSNPHIRDCYDHASRCHELARGARDKRSRDEFLAMEQRWLVVARNYETSHRLSRPGNSRSKGDPAKL